MAELAKVFPGSHKAEAYIHARRAEAVHSSYTSDSYEVVLPRRRLAESNFLVVGIEGIHSVGGGIVTVALGDTRGEGMKLVDSWVYGVDTPCSDGDGSRHLWVARR